MTDLSVSELPPAARPGGRSIPAAYRAAPLVLAVLLAGLDQTIVATALPSISGALAEEVLAAQSFWVITAYLLASAVAVPVFACLGEQLGRKRVFQASLVLFLAGSALAAAVGSMDQLVACRVLQGLGAGGLVIGAQGLIADLVPGRERDRYLGVLAGAFGVAVVTGPLLGGVLTTYAGWRWCFLLNLPLGLAALAVTHPVFRLPRPASRRHFDLAGTALLAGLSLCLTLIAAWGGARYAWGSPVILGLAGGAVVAIALFVVVERIAREPVLPLHLFNSISFAAVGLIGVTLGIAMFGLLLYLPLLLQTPGALSPVHAGLLMLPMVGGLVGAALATVWWISWRRPRARAGGGRIFLVTGLAIATVGTAAVSFLDAETGQITYGIVTAITGGGLGFALSGLLVAARWTAGTPAIKTPAIGTPAAEAPAVGGGFEAQPQSGLTPQPPDDLTPQPPGGFAPQTAGGPARDPDGGTVAATYLRQLGGALGVAAFGALTTHRLTAQPASTYEADPLPPPMAALTSHFLLAVPLLAVGVLLALMLRSARKGSAESDLFDGDDRYADDQYGDGVRHDADGIEQDRGYGTGLPQLGRGGNADLTSALSAGMVADAGAGTGAAPGTGAGTGPGNELGTTAEPSLPAEPAPLWVTVAQASGTPIEDVTLTLTNLVGQQVGLALPQQGGYQVELPEPGSYLMIVAAAGFHPYATVICYDGRTDHVEVTLYGERGVFGRVCRRDGSPVPGATVTLTGAAGEVVASQGTDADGEYEFRDLTGDTYTMAVSARAYRPTASVVSLPRAGKLRQDVELVGGAQLHGVIRSRTGRRPMPDARVTLIDSAGLVQGVAAAGLDGGYRFLDVPEGEYTVVATAHPPTASPVRITGGEDHELDLELRFPEPPVRPGF